MKRFHIHTHVEDLKTSIAFYAKPFGAEPSRVESDYAKWLLDDPRINFAIPRPDRRLDHLCIQADSEEELAELKARAAAADLALQDEGQTSCCHARSNKPAAPAQASARCAPRGKPVGVPVQPASSCC